MRRVSAPGARSPNLARVLTASISSSFLAPFIGACAVTPPGRAIGFRSSHGLAPIATSSTPRIRGSSHRCRGSYAPTIAYDRRMAERAEANARAGLPAWSLPAGAVDGIAISADWPERVTRAWAWGGSRGAGIRIAVVDSGIEHDHPL